MGGNKMIHLDMEQLAELKEVLEDEFQVLINTYIKDAEFRLTLIKQGLDNNNYETIRLAAHSLKGASANVGAVALSTLCEHLEHHCKIGEVQNLQTTFEQAQQEFHIVVGLLEKI